MMRLFDWPPIWLLGFVAAVWGMHAALPMTVFGSAGRWIGGALVLTGLGLMGAAALQMVAARTTVLPRSSPNALVTNGIFAMSRNPIYLADALVLSGAAFWWDVPLGLILVGVFMAVIQARFIRGEEAVLRAHFGTEYEDWCLRVRRWL